MNGFNDCIRLGCQEAVAAEVRAGCILLPKAAGQLDLSPKRRPNLWAGMPSSVIPHVGSGCRIVGPEVLAAVAPERFVLNASWFTRFNCRCAVLRGHVRLHCGLGGL